MLITSLPPTPDILAWHLRPFLKWLLVPTEATPATCYSLNRLGTSTPTRNFDVSPPSGTYPIFSRLAVSFQSEVKCHLLGWIALWFSTHCSPNEEHTYKERSANVENVSSSTSGWKVYRFCCSVQFFCSFKIFFLILKFNVKIWGES